MATMPPSSVDPDPSPPPTHPLRLPAVDLRLLSQSELNSLSHCSNSSFDPHRCHDVVIPKIDRSVFNESAGSRKQTYSRLRLAPPDSNSTIRRRAPRLRGSHTPASDLVTDPEQPDNSQIVRVLKELFKSDSNFDYLPQIEAENHGIVVAPESANPQPPEFINTQVSGLLNPKSPELSNTEAPELLNTEASELLNNEASELLNTENPNRLNTDAPELVNTENPNMLNTEASELVNTEAPESVNLLNTEAPVLLSTEGTELLNTEMKRKRGRPRKHEAAGLMQAPVAKRVRNSMVKKEVVYDDDKDRGIVNSRGVEVNLMDLGRLEDPYGPEIRRRTEGLSTADELLGFLRGLNGEWGTTRKKRRVVYASDFGDALPNGWRLSLCIKKKEGRVWVFCRRYISPSGRQFESCKDISAYLLSILGEENMDKPNHAYSNDYDDFALKGSSGDAANLCVQEDIKRNSTIDSSSTPPVSLPIDCDKKIIYGIVGPVDVPADDVFKCLKCFLIFEAKTDLLDHQSLSHKDEKPQHGSSLPDWSIVIGGIFNCNICHRTFYEVNQYNGHIGTHLTNENKAAEKTVDPVTSSAEIDHKMSFAIESEKVDEAVHDLDMNEDVLVEESGDRIGSKFVNGNIDPETDKAPDISVSVSRSECDLDQDIVGRSDGQDSGSETRVHSSSICEEKGFQANINDTHLCSSVDKLTTEKGKVVYSESSSGFFHDISNGQDAVSETRVHTSSICEEKGFRENISDMNISSSFDGLTSEKGKVVNNESSSGVFQGISDGQDAVSETRVQTLSICEEKGFRENIGDARIFSPFSELTSEKEKVVDKGSSSGVFHNRVGLDEDRLAETKKLSESESLSLFSNTFKVAVDNPSLISSKKPVPFQKLGFAPVDQVTHGFDENRFSYNVSSSKLDAQYEARNSEFGRYREKEHVNKGYIHTENNDKSSSKLDGQYEARNSDFGRYGEKEHVNKAYIHIENNDKSSFKRDGQYEVRNSEFGRYGEKEHVNKGYFHVENNVKSGEANLDEFQAFRNNESITHEVVSLGSSSQNGLNANVMDFNAGKNIEFCSLVPPGNNQAFGFQDGLKFDDIFGDKFDENIHELSLAFGNPNSLYEDTVGVNEQKKDGLNCSSVVPSKINDAFDVQTDLSMVNNSMVQDLKRGNESRRFQNNDNSVYSGRTWGDYKSDEFRNAEEKQFIMGSGSNQMWKTAQGNHLQSGLVNSHAQIQSPNFHSFDIMSQKAQDGLLRHNNGNNGRYNPGRSEPVEFRFLTDRSEQNPHALQPGSRVFPHMYNPGIEQGFDATFWMGKNAAMMPNVSGRNVITSVCTWCRNQFHLPAMAMHQQMQAGVGSLCPNCSAGISGQVNML